MPAGARVIRFKVLRAPVMQATGKRVPGFVATVFRKAKRSGRQTFALRSGKLARLRNGRYRIEVRAGASRSDLGPATNRLVTVRKGR